MLAIEVDMDKLKNTVLAPVNAVKDFMGKPREEKEYDSRMMSVLDNIKNAKDTIMEKKEFFKGLFFGKDKK